MSAIPQTLNISNSRTTCAKSINLHTTRKLIEYSSKNKILLFKGSTVLSPAQRSAGSERFNGHSPSQKKL